MGRRRIKTSVESETRPCCYKETSGNFFDILTSVHERVFLLNNHGLGVILVTTGFPRDSQTRTTETVDLGEEPEKDQGCLKRAFSDFPLPISYATGGLIGGKTPVVCGGTKSGRSARQTCYIMEPGKNPRSKMMLTPRLHSASIGLGSSLFVTGGYGIGSKVLSSTEFVHSGQQVGSSGPSLPIPLNRHCFVRFNSTTALAISGQSDQNQYNGQTYFYWIQDQKWTTGPSVSIPRYSHACGLLKEQEAIVTIGGRSPSIQRYPKHPDHVIEIYTPVLGQRKYGHHSPIHGPVVHLCLAMETMEPRQSLLDPAFSWWVGGKMEAGYWSLFVNPVPFHLASGPRWTTD